MIYEHYKNHKLYLLVDKCKIQESGIWISAIRYKEFNGELDVFFVRSEVEFNAKFIKKEDFKLIFILF